MELKDHPLEELKAELARREEERERQVVEDRRRRLGEILDNREALLRLIPHSRTSCSDSNPVNGLYSAEYGARCIRCGLTELNEFSWMDFDVEFNVEIRKLKK